MGCKPQPITLNVIGVSDNPKITAALSKAAETMKDSVRFFRLGADFSELPVLLEGLDEASTTLVFLEHPAVADPKLILASEQIREKVDQPVIWLLAKKDPQPWPTELSKAYVLGLMTPPFEWALFRRVMYSATCYYC